MKATSRLLLCLLVALSTAFGIDVYSDNLHRFDYDSKAPLDVHNGGASRHGGVTVRDITYAGARGPVPAYLVTPTGDGPFAAIIWGHWMMEGSPLKNRKEFLNEAELLAGSGVVSLLIDAPMVRPGFVDDRPDAEYTLQDVIDIRRGIDLLTARKDVDPKRLAFVGHSFHGGSAAVLAGVEKRLRAVVIMAGGLDHNVFARSTAPELVKIREKIGPERVQKYLESSAWINPCQYVAHAAPTPVLMQYATHDQFMTTDDAKAYLSCVSEPREFKTYNADHALNAEARRDRVDFLRVQLKLAPVDARALAAIPQVK